MRMRISGVLVVVLALGASARADEVQEARDHYRRAIKAYEVADYEEAIREFASAYKIKDDPNLLFNLAQAYRLGGRREEALREYRMYLNKVPNAPNRHEVEALIDGLQESRPANVEDPDSELARRYFDAGAKKYDARDYDGAIAEFEKARMVKPVAALDFNIGRSHDRLGHVEQALAAYRRYVATRPEPADAAEIKARITTLEQRLSSQPQTPTPPQPVQPAPQPKLDVRAGRTLRVAGIAVGVVGVAALAGGIACGVLAQQNADDITKATQMMGTYPSAKDATGKSEQIAEGVLLGVGGAAVVTGVVLVVMGQRARHRSMAVLPDVHSGRAGIVLQGAF